MASLPSLSSVKSTPPPPTTRVGECARGRLTGLGKRAERQTGDWVIPSLAARCCRCCVHACACGCRLPLPLAQGLALDVSSGCTASGIGQ